MDAKKLGNLGEKIAEKYLCGKGFEILTGQYHASKLGEIDIIAEKDGHLHFVEVKTRTHNPNFQENNPEDAINYTKQKRIKMSVFHFLMTHNIPRDDFQIDCIAIELNQETRKAKIRYLEYII